MIGHWMKTWAYGQWHTQQCLWNTICLIHKWLLYTVYQSRRPDVHVLSDDTATSDTSVHSNFNPHPAISRT
eukprot:15311702-Ditylum_brightwellii.AAC.1